MATADANQNCVTIIRHSFLFLARSLASLISILLSFWALFTPSSHPNLGLPLALLPSTFAFITFSAVVHYPFSLHFIQLFYSFHCLFFSFIKGCRLEKGHIVLVLFPFIKNKKTKTKIYIFFLSQTRDSCVIVHTVPPCTNRI